MKEEKNDIDELIAAYLSGGMRKPLPEELSAWINRSEENRRYFMQQEEIWFSAIREEEREWYDADKAFGIFSRRVAQRQAETVARKRRILNVRALGKYAAMVAAVSLVAFFSSRQGGNDLKDALAKIEVEAPAGSQTRMRLPDSTWVVLNAGSRMVYSQDFGVESREVELEGEGYFEVARNEEMPFHVNSEHVRVTVLGTKFNFKDYPEEEEVVVSLKEGKVMLGNRVRAEKDMILMPDERMVMDKSTGRMKLEKVKNKAYLRWMDGKLVFDEMSLEEVAKVLERCYGFKVVLENDSLRRIRLYGNFNRAEQSLQDILEAMKGTDKIRYHIDNKEKEVILY